MSTRTQRLLKLLDAGTKKHPGADRALYLLLRRYESTLPELDDMFHKSFRQLDITDSPETDMAIWHLIGQSELFWAIFNAVTGTNTGSSDQATDDDRH